MVRNSILGASLACFSATAALAGDITFVPSDLEPGDQYHVAFISFSGHDASSGDVAVYNAFVQAQAEQEGAEPESWGVSWFAVASTETVDARDNVTVDAAPVYLLSDVRLADDAADLWDGEIQSTFSVNQFGDSESTQNVWTGTSNDGTGLDGAELGTSDPRHGFSGDVTRWVSFGNEPGDNLRAFYAISEVLTVPEDEPGTDFTLRAEGVFENEGNDFFVTADVTEQDPALGLVDFSAAFEVQEAGDPDTFAGTLTLSNPEGELSGTMVGFAIFLGDLAVLAGEFEIDAGSGVYEGVTGGGAITGIGNSGQDPAFIRFDLEGSLVGSLCNEALDGDLDFNGCTDFNDLLIVLSLWDSAGPEGDGNCDGVVDFNDLLLVLSGWSDEGECD